MKFESKSDLEYTAASPYFDRLYHFFKRAIEHARFVYRWIQGHTRRTKSALLALYKLPRTGCLITSGCLVYDLKPEFSFPWSPKFYSFAMSIGVALVRSAALFLSWSPSPFASSNEISRFCSFLKVESERSQFGDDCAIGSLKPHPVRCFLQFKSFSNDRVVIVVTWLVATLIVFKIWLFVMNFLPWFWAGSNQCLGILQLSLHQMKLYPPR